LFAALCVSNIAENGCSRRRETATLMGGLNGHVYSFRYELGYIRENVYAHAYIAHFRY